MKIRLQKSNNFIVTLRFKVALLCYIFHLIENLYETITFVTVICMNRTAYVLSNFIVNFVLNISILFTNFQYQTQVL